MTDTTQSVKNQQLAKMIQKALADLFITETAQLCGHTLIAITAVELDRSCATAKVYLSFPTHDHPQSLLAKVVSSKNRLRRLMGSKLRGKMRKIPDLKFYIDRSISQGARITTLIEQLEMGEKTTIHQSSLAQNNAPY